MAAAQQHPFDGMTIAEIISAAQQHQFDDLTMTVAEVEEIWRHRGAIIAEAEEVLRQKKSWLNLTPRLFIIFMGVYMIIRGAITSGLTRTDWIAIGISICWDAYLRTQMEHFPAFTQSLDLESAGLQLAVPTDHRQDPSLY